MRFSWPRSWICSSTCGRLRFPRQSAPPGDAQQPGRDGALGHGCRADRRDGRIRRATPPDGCRRRPTGGVRRADRATCRCADYLRAAGMHLFKSLSGLIMVEVAITLPFGVLLTRAFMASIPSDIDQAAIIDGAARFHPLLECHLPLLRPVLITLIVTSSVAVYNDFVNPIYFTPGGQHDGAAHAVQLPKPVRKPVEPVVRRRALDHHSAAHHVHHLQPKMVEGITAGAVKG